jgi:hypothetical protein
MLLAPLLLCAVTPVSAMRAPAAHTHVVAQKSVKKGVGGLTLYGALKQGHKYRIEVVSTGKYAVTGSGFQNYTYKSGKQVGQGTKGFTLKGTTPFTMDIRAPTQATLMQWVLAVEVSIAGRHALTVRYRDLGSTR